MDELHTVTGTYSEIDDEKTNQKEDKKEQQSNHYLISEGIEGFTSFPEDWKKEFEGLTYIGALSSTIKLTNYHTFTIRTLLPAEKIEISIILKDLEDSMGYGRGYRAAVVAASVTLVDGKPIMAFDKNNSPIREKYDYVINTYYDPVIDAVYSEVDKLEGRAAELAAELLKKKDGN